MERVRSFTVVAAVIRDGTGRILLTRRPEDKHMGGLWEFPGGKLEDGEGPAEGLQRELDEELAIEIEVKRPLTFAVHEEAGLRILLLFYEASITGGAVRGREGQEMAWAAPAELQSYPMPPADAELVESLARLDHEPTPDLP